MSIGRESIGELPVGGHSGAQLTIKLPPRRRFITAKADIADPPEAR